MPRPVRITITRYLLNGNRVPKGTPGAVKVTEKSDSYYVRLKEPGEAFHRKIPLGTADEATAWRKLNELLRRRNDEAAGIRDRTHDEAGKPLADHVEDWCKAVAAGGAGEEYVEVLRHRVKRLARAAGWDRITEIDEDSCLAGLAMVVKEDGVGPQTRNHYRRHVLQFTRWLARGKSRRLREDPLAGMDGKVSVETDIRHRRRIPTDDEVNRLFFSLVENSWRVRYGMTGSQRALGYKICMSLGVRAGELRVLCRHSFDLDRGTAFVPAAYDKRRRIAEQPMPPWLADELRAWFDAGGGCWPFPEDHPGDVLQRDLKDAGIPYKTVGSDGQPDFLDMHSLRHYYVTELANQPGISPKVLMVLARHSTADLSMRVYAKAKDDAVRAAVAAVGQPGVVAPARNGAVANGVAPVGESWRENGNRSEARKVGEDDDAVDASKGAAGSNRSE